jgi:hypothetical protein
MKVHKSSDIEAIPKELYKRTYVKKAAIFAANKK